MFAKIAGNPVFRAIYDAMATWLQAQRRAAPTKPADYQRGYREHKRIFEAVAARNADAAQEAMQDHLEHGWNWSGAAIRLSKGAMDSENEQDRADPKASLNEPK
jgi:DNA-binding FadR family transcriptional regulator